MDREKVIKGLYQHCKGSMFDRCGECPYYDVDHENGFVCRDELLSDALELLKEQDAVKPTVGGAEEHDGHDSWWYQCGECKMPIDYSDGFCRHCGRPVKWE